MHVLKRLAALLLVLFATVGCDQATKSLAQTHLSDAPPRFFLNGLFSLHYAENPGAFLSLGAALPGDLQRWVFTIAVTIVLVAVFIFTLREMVRVHVMVLVSLALFLGGGIGNLIDRFTNDGRVIDFMHISFAPIGMGTLRTGVFNVADMALLTGVALLGLYSWRQGANHTAADPTND